MDWRKTLLKAVKAALIAGASLAAVTLAQNLIAVLKDRPDAWAIAVIALLTAFLNWNKHRND